VSVLPCKCFGGGFAFSASVDTFAHAGGGFVFFSSVSFSGSPVALAPLALDAPYHAGQC